MTQAANMSQNERLVYMLKELLQEDAQYRNMQIPADPAAQKELLRALMNVRLPKPLSPEFLQVQDAYFQQETKDRGVVELSSLKPVGEGPLNGNLYLWRGDITRLAVGAIVNAANSQMLGCFIPNHHCIDNAIHTFAGMELRQEMAEIMDKQGHEEPVGQAKITPAYYLPAHYVLHTVGPYVAGKLTSKEEQQLASCYTSCLDLAASYHVDSVAFCCISTGVFRFPPQRAAEIAVDTVKSWLKNHDSKMKVVFNVFTQQDEQIYAKLLGSAV